MWQARGPALHRERARPRPLAPGLAGDADPPLARQDGRQPGDLLVLRAANDAAFALQFDAEQTLAARFAESLSTLAADLG